ncbi:MAG: M48 family metallopeptidase [Hyphomonadaceae bacterium]|nr:M48 family metallopeptidase [Hyphomonadaceae bacterium]
MRFLRVRLDSQPKAEEPTQTEIETIDGKRVPVKLIVNPRARNVSVRIDPTRREAIATAPSKRYLKHAAQFAAERAGWIAEELSRLPKGVSLTPGAFVYFRGVEHELAFQRGRGPARVEPGLIPRLIVQASDPALFESRVVRFFKEQAREELIDRVARHAVTLGVKPVKIQVKELRSRWGSCSVDGVLSFSWRLILAPPFVLDYLAAHEVAHLREMNHSRRFWAHVKRCMPNYEAGRDWLHDNGSALHAVGLAR